MIGLDGWISNGLWEREVPSGRACDSGCASFYPAAAQALALHWILSFCVALYLERQSGSTQL